MLESLTALRDGLLVIEVPRSTLVRRFCRGIGLGRLLGTVADGRLLGNHLLGLGFFTGTLFLLFLLLEVGNNLVDDFEPFFLRHLGQPLQGVLQLDGTGMGSQLVKDLGTL